MRVLHFLVLGLFLASPPVWAQEEAAVYRIADVTVDVTADNASQARDKAIFQAQKQGFDLLLTRLGSSARAGGMDEDSIARMVRAFDVQKEYAAGKRYTGTFTLHFRPEAVREFLSQKGATYTEERAEPFVVIPVMRQGKVDVLWEDRTPWRDAWEEASLQSGLIPLIVPPGELDDIAAISAAEALAGHMEKFQGLKARYNAGGVLVVLLAQDEDGKSFIESFPYRENGQARGATRVEIENPAGKKNAAEILKKGIQQIIASLEAAWRNRREKEKEVSSAPAAPSASGQGAATAATPSFAETPPSFLPVDAPVPTLAAWAQIRNALAQIPAVISTHVITMTRGLVHFEMQFRGDLESLRDALEEKGLSLDQGRQGGWVIQRKASSEDM